MNSVSNEIILCTLSLIFILYITNFLLTNILKYKSSFTHAFVFLIFNINLIDSLSKIFNKSLDSLSIYLLAIVMLSLIVVIKNKQNLFSVNHKYLLVSTIIGLIALSYSTNYCNTVSLSSNTASIKYLGYFINNDSNIYFYTFFNYLLGLSEIKEFEFINSFTTITTFLFYFLLSDFILYCKKDNNRDLIPSLSYFAFFINFLCLKFTYVTYVWLIFPINVAMSYINKKDLGIIDSLFLSISLYSTVLFFEDKIMTILLIAIILVVLELTGTIKDNKYKYFLLLFLIISIYFDQQYLIINLELIVLLLICIFINMTNIRKYFVPIFTIVLIYILGKSIYNFNIEGYNLSNIQNGLLSIDFIGANNRLFFLTGFYCIMLLICLINLKKTKRTILTVLIISLIIFNPLLLYECSNNFNTINPLEYILFNPTIIALIYSSTIKVLKKYNMNNGLSLALLIISFYSTSNALYPNIFEKDLLFFDKNIEYNSQYRMEEDELDVYEYLDSNDIEISGNIVSQAPNTIAYIKNVSLLNDYYYYIDLLNNELDEAPNNLTNIFAIRKYNNVKYFLDDADYEKSNKELEKYKYDYLLLRKDQYIIDELELIYLYYKDHDYKIIYENSTYALLKVKDENDL